MPGPYRITSLRNIRTKENNRVEKMDLNEFIGQKVTLTGNAKDAKGGAVVLEPNGTVVYIKGLWEWPDELFDKQVSVTGVLKNVKLIPDPVNEAGEICTGAWGNDWVIEDAEYFEKITD